MEMMTDRLKYRWSDEELESETSWGQQECDAVAWEKASAVGTSDLSRVLSFQFPSDPRFTDTSCTVLHMTCRVLCGDGSPLAAEDEVFLSVDDGSGFFSTSQVALGNYVLRAFDLCAYGAQLMNIFGSSCAFRKNTWSPLSGHTYMPPGTFAGSKVDNASKGNFYAKVTQCALSREINIFLRFPSPFLQSLAQLLPPSIPLSLTLRRVPDSFVLSTLASSRANSYKLSITYAACYVKRVRLSDCLMSKIMPSLQYPAWSLKYVRLASSVSQIAQGSQVFRATQLLDDQSPKLPQRVYAFLVSQAAFHGSYDRLSLYHETAALDQIQLTSGGQNLLLEPIKTKFAYADDGDLKAGDSDALQAYLCAMSALNIAFEPRSSPVLSYTSYLMGCFTYIARLSACGGGGPLSGSMAIEISFARPLPEPYMLCLIAEYPSRLTSTPEGGFTMS